MSTRQMSLVSEKDYLEWTPVYLDKDVVFFVLSMLSALPVAHTVGYVCFVMKYL